jgi:hypothetical protein
MSDAGADRDGRLPAVAYGATNDEYFVTWNGDGVVQPDNDDEIFGHMSEIAPVPVLFTGLHVRARGDGAEIAWSVYADEEISGFRVYRSDGNRSAINIVEGGMLAPQSRQYFDGGVHAGSSYEYVISAVKPDGSEIRSAPRGFTLKPLAFSMSQNYPNPFNPTTTIRYDLPAQGQVSITIFDVTGAVVATLVDKRSPAGTFEVQWHGRNNRGFAAASGTYFYRLVARLDDGRKFSQVKKLVLTK